MWRSLLCWLTSSNTNNLTVIAGAVLTLAINSLLTVTLTARSEEHAQSLLLAQFEQANIAARNKELASRAEEVRSAAADFSTFAAAYVAAVVDETNLKSHAKKQLQTSVIRQLSTLQMSGGIFKGEVARAADTYSDALYGFNESLNGADNVLAMRKFWESASAVLVARDDLLRAVDREV